MPAVISARTRGGACGVTRSVSCPEDTASCTEGIAGIARRRDSPRDDDVLAAHLTLARFRTR
jgi:hypothetical protein